MGIGVLSDDERERVVAGPVRQMITSKVIDLLTAFFTENPKSPILQPSYFQFQVKMDDHKRRFLTCAEEDTMSSKLPESLVRSVLERLPIQDAVRTSILSKKWRYKWTAMNSLVFDEQFSKKFAKNGAFGRNGFISIINQVLILHLGPISKFSLHIPPFNLYSFQEIDRWILFLSRNNVKELVISDSNGRYKLPSQLSSCSELRKLELNNCILMPPLKFEGFPDLEDLILKNIDFRDNSCGTVVTLPKLRNLFLYACTNAYNFNIDARKLEVLVVEACHDAKLIRLLDSPCLTRVAILFMKTVVDVRGETLNLAMLFSNWPKIEHFYTNGNFLKFLGADNIPKRFPHAVNSLKGLRLLNCQLSDLDQLYGALCLLQNSPNLERLCMKDQQVRPLGRHYDVRPASNHLGFLAFLEFLDLEFPDCLDQTLNQLQTVDIEGLEGSRLELHFIKLLFAHSPSLNKMTIQPSGTCDASKRHNIAKDVMRFPRASPKAELIYLDPKP